MLGVGQGDNVDLFSSSWDCFLTIPRPSLLILLSPSTLSELSERGSPHPLVSSMWVFILGGCKGEIRTEFFFDTGLQVNSGWR